MMSTFNHNNKKRKIRLGKSTDLGYGYSAKIDFRKDFSSQIADYIKERQAYDSLNFKIKKLREYVKEFSNIKKEKSLSYYYKIGKELSRIIKDKVFKEISPYSIFRRIKEEIPEILPHVKNIKRAQKHLEIMHKLGHINEKYLIKATWDQWYEIMKFKGVYKDQELLKQILIECKSGISGPSLRTKIKTLIEKTKN